MNPDDHGQLLTRIDDSWNVNARGKEKIKISTWEISVGKIRTYFKKRQSSD